MSGYATKRARRRFCSSVSGSPSLRNGILNGLSSRSSCFLVSSFCIFGYRLNKMFPECVLSHPQIFRITVPAVCQRGNGRTDTGKGKRDEQDAQDNLSLFPVQPAAEQPECQVCLPDRIPSHRSTLLRSLFSRMVRCSMMNPLGLSSEREVFCSWHSVTSERSVTLLCRMIICRA